MAATFEEIGELLEIRVATAVGHAREMFESGAGILQDLRLAETNRPTMSGGKPSLDKVRVCMLGVQQHLGEAKKLLEDIYANWPAYDHDITVDSAVEWDSYGSNLVNRGVISQRAYDDTTEGTHIADNTIDLINHAMTDTEARIRILLDWVLLFQSNERVANEFNKHLEGPIFTITAARDAMNVASEILDAFIHFNRCVCEQVRLHTQP